MIKELSPYYYYFTILQKFHINSELGHQCFYDKNNYLAQWQIDWFAQPSGKTIGSGMY